MRSTAREEREEMGVVFQNVKCDGGVRGEYLLLVVEWLKAVKQFSMIMLL